MIKTKLDYGLTVEDLLILSTLKPNFKIQIQVQQ